MGLRGPALGDERLREMPKAGSRVHAEGTLEPEMMLEMAAVRGYGSDTAQ
jgi:hypothetical protein